MPNLALLGARHLYTDMADEVAKLHGVKITNDTYRNGVADKDVLLCIVTELILR